METALVVAAMASGAAIQVGGEVGAKSTAPLVNNASRTPKGTEWAVGCGERAFPQYAARSTGGSVPAGVLGSLGSAAPMAEGSLGQITALPGMTG